MQASGTFGFAGESVAARVARLRRLAWLLDAALRLPGTRVRVGLNGLIGFTPVLGDVLMGAFSLYIVFEAAQLGLPREKLARMLANVAIEVVAGSVASPVPPLWNPSAVSAAAVVAARCAVSRMSPLTTRSLGLSFGRQASPKNIVS